MPDRVTAEERARAFMLSTLKASELGSQARMVDVRDALAASYSALEREVVERLIAAVRAACVPCGGSGSGGPGPDGTEVECEYCGRPIHAIRQSGGEG